MDITKPQSGKSHKKIAKPNHLSEHEIHALQRSSSALLEHIGEAFLVRAGLPLVSVNEGSYGVHAHSPDALDAVDVGNIGAAVLQLVSAAEAKELLGKAAVEVARGFDGGRVADNEDYLFKGDFAEAYKWDHSAFETDSETAH